MLINCQRVAQAATRQPLDHFRSDLYEVVEITTESDRTEYVRTLTYHYERLGFMAEWVLPAPNSRQFLLRHAGEVSGLFRLTEVSDTHSHLRTALQRSVGSHANNWRLIELNNVLVRPEFRGTPVLGLILYRSACEAHAAGYDCVVGLTRVQVLRFMVDFGVIPVDHPPLSVMEKQHLVDFVTYFDTRRPESIAYMHERAKRYFHQEFVMRNIREKYLGSKAQRRGEERAEPSAPREMAHLNQMQLA